MEKRAERLLKRFMYNVKILIAIMLLIASLTFVWINELVMSYNGAMLTNGFNTFDGLQQYHKAMYLMFFFDIAAAFVIIKEIHKNTRGKV